MEIEQGWIIECDACNDIEVSYLDTEYEAAHHFKESRWHLDVDKKESLCPFCKERQQPC